MRVANVTVARIVAEMRSRSVSVHTVHPSRWHGSLLALELPWGGSLDALEVLRVQPLRAGAQLMAADGYALSGRRVLTLAEES
ncbi:hypothetical protein PENSPDRAFT_686897 [Peniophora sp. CONT]|nr:hypothetical protein PENSPDRAFT_686897 [Peniophora sp. CONT]